MKKTKRKWGTDMKLKTILAGIEGLKVRGDLETEISSIQQDSKKVEKNSLFVAIQGFSADGHQYIEKAIQAGAIAVMVQEDCDKQYLKK